MGLRQNHYVLLTVGLIVLMLLAMKYVLQSSPKEVYTRADLPEQFNADNSLFRGDNLIATVTPDRSPVKGDSLIVNVTPERSPVKGDSLIATVAPDRSPVKADNLIANVTPDRSPVKGDSLIVNVTPERSPVKGDSLIANVPPDRSPVKGDDLLSNVIPDRSPVKADNLIANVTADKNPPKLTSKIINRIKKFVFFVGYERSGNSIVGALLDTHPHVVIPHEYLLFDKFSTLNLVPQNTRRKYLFTELYRYSSDDSLRAASHKGYSLKVEGLWQGRFDDHIEVIGDKSGGLATRMYLKDKEQFKKNVKQLQKMVNIPLRIIHVLRNPFDIISTDVLMKVGGLQSLKCMRENCGKNKTNYPDLQGQVDYMFTRFRAVRDIIDTIIGRENTIEIHNCDLVADSKATLSKLFEFLEVETTEHYLDVCAEKVFKSVSRSRDWVVWPQQQVDLVEKQIQQFSMLSRYNFTSN